jgi:hypothetical protein
MRITKTALVLTLCALSALAIAAGKPANYAGAWELDKAQSRNLPKFYEQVASHTLVNTQDAQLLHVDVEIKRAPAPEGEARRGPGERKVAFDYRLDGTPAPGKTSVRTPAGMKEFDNVTTTTVNEAGGVHIETVGEVPTKDGAVKSTTVEDWTLSADGRTLTVRRSDDAPMARFNSELVFVRK